MLVNVKNVILCVLLKLSKNCSKCDDSKNFTPISLIKIPARRPIPMSTRRVYAYAYSGASAITSQVRCWQECETAWVAGCVTSILSVALSGPGDNIIHCISPPALIYIQESNINLVPYTGVHMIHRGDWFLHAAGYRKKISTGDDAHISSLSSSVGAHHMMIRMLHLRNSIAHPDSDAKIESPSIKNRARKFGSVERNQWKSPMLGTSVWITLKHLEWNKLASLSILIDNI